MSNNSSLLGFKSSAGISNVLNGSRNSGFPKPHKTLLDPLLTRPENFY